MISDSCITTYDYCAKDNDGFTHVVPTDLGGRGGRCQKHSTGRPSGVTDNNEPCKTCLRSHMNYFPTVFVARRLSLVECVWVRGFKLEANCEEAIYCSCL